MKITVLTIFFAMFFCIDCRPLHPGETGEIITQTIAIDLTYADRFPVSVAMKTKNPNIKGK